jgi:hypothetical protein
MKETEEQLLQGYKEMIMYNIYRNIKVIPLKSCHAKYGRKDLKGIK